MKNFSLAFIIFLLWTTFGLWLYSWITPMNAIASDNNTSPEFSQLDVINDDNLETTVPFAVDTIAIIKDPVIEITGLTARSVASDIIFSFDESFSFKKDSVNVVIPSSVKEYKNKLHTYLNEHPELELHIFSIYSPTERLENPNLGIQRGEFIIEELKKLGISENRLVVQSVIEDIDFKEDNSYDNNISFQFKPLDENRIATIKPKKVEIPKNITFYPRFSDSGIMKSDELDALLISVKQVLDDHPTIRLRVIGHTDDVLNANYNLSVGQKYAEEIKWYFKAKGNINPRRIIAMSRGELRPIRSNKTASGRRANRRIELQFIK